MPELGIDFTTDNLIAELKVRQTMPTSAGLFTDDDFVRLLNAAMHKVVAAIHRVKEEYFVTYSDTAIVAGQNAYTIPARAVAGQLRDIVIVDAAGVESELVRIDATAEKNADALFGVILRGHQAVIVPTPASAVNSVRFKYERRPNNLVKTSLAGKISSIDTALKQIVVVTKPSTWAIGTKLDFISGDPIFQSRQDGNVIAGISGFTITMTTALGTDLAVGDYAAQSGFSPIAQLPYEGHLVIAQYGAAWSMRSLSNKEPAKDAEHSADESLRDFISTINPRIDGEAKKFANTGGGIWAASAGDAGGGWRLNVGP